MSKTDAAMNILIPSGPLNSSQEFAGIRDFVEWCIEQREFIKRLLGTAPDKQKLAVHFYSKLEKLLQLANEVGNPIERINEELAKLASSGLIMSNSSVGRLLEGQLKGNSTRGFLVRVAGHNLENEITFSPEDRTSLYIGYCLASSFLTVDQTNNQNIIQDSRLELAEVTQQLQGAKRLLLEQQENLVKVSNEFGEKLSTFQDKQLQVEASYQEALSLDIAKKYWEKKFRRHDIKARLADKRFGQGSKSGSISIGSMALFSALLYLFFPSTFSNFIVDISLMPFGWSLLSAAFIFTPLFLYIWFLRTQQSTSRLHRQYAEDAQMRSTMMVVYLALMKQDSNAVTPDERALLLNAIFRPLEGGQKDDGPPPGVLEFLTRQHS